MATTYSNLSRLPQLDDIAPGGRIGLLCLATDVNTEQELRLILPDNIGIYANRISYTNPLTIGNLRAMERDIARASQGILPGLGVDVMIYACTSGSAAIGCDGVDVAIRTVYPKIQTTDPIRALMAALDSFSAKRISILTPYREDVNRLLASTLSANGVDVLNVSGFGMDSDIDIAGLPLEEITRAAVKTCREEADLLFLSCTAMRGARTITQLEEILGRPVLASNQVIAWHALRLMGKRDPVRGYGQLFNQENGQESG